ncbi:MAG: serine/threonine protein kinase [Myxococcales bacterium]|jgi:serine/threonine-protein kinase|nr:serine/threonine protein kinase [Myxococcales bacterium]
MSPTGAPIDAASSGALPPASMAPESTAATADPADGMPKRFGKYTLLRKLAQGGMAELFLAIQRSVAGFEKLIVIKRILPAVSQDTAFIEMLLHEARVAATLSHPNVCQTFDVGQVDGSYFIAMEHVHGEDLRSIVRQMKKRDVNEFPVEHALAIILGMCAGLAYAHEHHDMNGQPLHIVHRDVSPQNVVVTFGGDVKIVDFGIAKSDKRFAEHTKSGKLKGKVPYMSPEQARGEAVDARTDIFATGIMLFELTTGKRLFKGGSEFETLKLICDEEYPLPSQVRSDYPKDLEAIVMRALAKNKDERYPSARAMQRDLEEFVRRHRVGVSSLALHGFMQSLFEDKLAAQKEALSQGKQLADIIDSQHAHASMRPPESTMEFDAFTNGARLVTPSMPAAAHTVTDAVAHGRGARGPWFAVGVGAAVLLAIGAGVLGGLRARHADEALASAAVPARPPARGTLVVTSDPPGASIWLNGDLRTETTPASLELPRGVELDVKLSMADHEQSRHKVTLTDGLPTQEVRAQLRRGSVVLNVVLSPPAADATFTIDGKLAAGPEVADLSSGVEHTVTVSAPGFVDKSVTFTGGPLEKKRLDVALERSPTAVASHDRRPAPSASASAHTAASAATPPPAAAGGVGKLNVGASGGWCNVTVDGKPRGATPAAGIELPAGTHKITCTTAEGKALSATVQVPADGVARYKFSL